MRKKSTSEPYQGLHCGNATVIPNRTLHSGATGASSRQAIHSPLTKTLRGGQPSRTVTCPSPKLTGSSVGWSSFQPLDQVASADFT